MRVDATSSSTRAGRGIGWWVFGVGLVLAPLIFTISSTVSHPHWDWRTSVFAHRIAPALLLLGLLVCTASPFLTGGTLARRILLSTLAALAFVVACLCSHLGMILLYGI